jgi:glutamine---fructose-6-phosphate transaminase (isomerizing)
MCGIVGYCGTKNAQPILVDGLKRLEYRGYDSAGLSVMQSHEIVTVKTIGKVERLVDRLKDSTLNGTIGIAHTRWATHGKPSESNAHPHYDCLSKLSVIHNGIVENHYELRQELERKGHEFQSETDTEVIAHLLEDAMKECKSLPEAVRLVLPLLEGTFGMIAMSVDDSGTLVAARMGSPLILGVGKDEYFLASDATALLKHTRNMVYLDDGEMAIVNSEGYEVRTFDNKAVRKTVEELLEDIAQVQKNGHAHFMLKEMMEQPEVIMNTIRGRLDIDNGTAVLGGLRDVAEKLRDIKRIIIVGCGSAYYAGLIGEYMLEEYAGISVEVEFASEFRYRKPVLDKRTAVIAISQSGETADTLAAIREAKEKGSLTLGIINAVGTTIARETDAGVYNHAGPEIGVASTKAFLSQVTVLALFALFLGRQRSLSLVMGQRIAKEIKELPNLVEELLKRRDVYRTAASHFEGAEHSLFLGRKYCHPIAHEGALKIKEISYIHAEGYAAGEMKHGPIALIEDGFPVVVIAPKDSVFDKSMSNLQEIKARGGKVLLVTTDGAEHDTNLIDSVITIPKTLEMLTPILAVIPLQFLAYETACMRSCDPDMPRNLAKSVTVE